MKKNIVLAFIILVLSACSNWVTKPTEQMFANAPKKIIKPPPPPAPMERQPGSLWSEDSDWNGLYSLSLLRKQGDIIFVKPTEGFKTLMKDKGGQLADRDKTTVGQEGGGIATTIKQVLPRGVYLVSSHQVTKTATGDQEIAFQGKVRDRDVSEDESVSSDLMFDIKLDVVNHNIMGDKKDVVVAKEEKKPAPPAEEKKK